MRPLFVVILLAALPSLRAGTLSYSGDLRSASFLSCGAGCTLDTASSDAEYAQFAAIEVDFSVPVASAMQAITFSYGGGVNGNGAAIGQGGFQPYLSLFDGSGNFLGSTYSGTTCPAGANTNTDSGQCYDVLLDGGLLAPGNYALTISAYLNMSYAENLGTGTLADGFTGLGNLAFGEDLHYAVDVVLPDVATVPEPGGLGLAGGAVLLLLEIGRRRL